MLIPLRPLSIRRRAAGAVAVLLLPALLAARAISAKPPVRGTVVVGLADASGAKEATLWGLGAFDPVRGWIKDAEARRLFARGTRFTLYSLSRKPASGRLTGLPQDSEAGGGYSAPLATAGKAPEHALALSGPIGASVQPRAIHVGGAATPADEKALVALLKTEGRITVARPHMTQILHVDLNGDGSDEVLLTAEERLVNNDGEPEDPAARARLGKSPVYTAVALRCRGENGAIETVPLAMNTFRKDSTDSNEHYEVLTCADINGDGKMEVVLYSQYSEGEGISVFRFDGRQVKRVLNASWGA